ncbi:hypothetical protein EII29_07495 [Leptotrichia sp. OH3620_COT-345]|uniref:hypothetical protein n=1 Tax=Leptotrichia sp. OH3620_COT-345 TaxID=2491048 RepID=UPI000F655623|nr:hypothetical protein [Leptotrichia sp. OH3620_COT-345]RRD39243.1 hypothetical protein EII29_07495 [Leptotrichia sp. OH3620_COT-345]
MNVMYIYKKDDLELIAQPVITTVNEFKESPEKFYPDWNSETMAYSETLLINPIIDKNGELREMTEYEKAKAGKITLKEGQYLDESSKIIITVPKPNPYSVWKNTIWEEDKVLKLQYLKDERYKKQQEYLRYKHELEEKQKEKTEFEELGFDTSETEERIIEINAEMDLLKKEITKLSKEIKTLEKEVKE